MSIIWKTSLHKKSGGKLIKSMTGNTIKDMGALVVITGACVTCSRLKYTIKSSGLHNNDYAYLSCVKAHTVGMPFCVDRVSLIAPKIINSAKSRFQS